MALKPQLAQKKQNRVCRFSNWIKENNSNRDLSCKGSSNSGCKNCKNYKYYQKELLSTLDLAQKGDIASIEKIIKEFKSYAYQMEKRYFIPGGDREDLIQEAFIGLYHAIKTFRRDAGLAFEDYVSLSIRNSVIRAIRTANQKKQLVLTQARSIFDKSFLNIKSKKYEPENATMKTLKVQEVEKIISEKLSKRESKIITLKAKGYSAEEIANACDTEKKIVDNALYRARIKIRKHMETPSTRPVVNVRAYERFAKISGRRRV